MDKISIIIPVHNGAIYLWRIAKCVLKQTYKNIELIFVENGSSDDSLKALKEIEKTDCRVKVFISNEHGTSLARKKGVEAASGKYTVFMDQDDIYSSKKAIEKMHQIIVANNAQICQFSFYREFQFHLRKKVSFTKNTELITVEQVRENEIISMLTCIEGKLSTSVWSKIYLTSVLKDAVRQVNFPLFYAEDMFLNVCCIMSNKTKKVCIDKNAFYIWKTYTGFSSKDSGLALMDDYDIIKPIILQKLKETGASSEVLFRFNQESLYFAFNYLKSRIYKMEYNEAIELILDINERPFVKSAKEYVNKELGEEKKYEELIFLASDYNCEEFYKRFK